MLTVHIKGGNSGLPAQVVQDHDKRRFQVIVAHSDDFIQFCLIILMFIDIELSFVKRGLDMLEHLLVPVNLDHCHKKLKSQNKPDNYQIEHSL